MIGIATSPELAADTDVEAEVARLLKLLGDRTRLRIFLLLLRGEMCNCELAQQLALPQNLISHHITLLREAGLVRERRDLRDGRWIHYRVDVDALGVAWHALAAVLDPSRVGSRTPVCCASAADQLEKDPHRERRRRFGVA